MFWEYPPEPKPTLDRDRKVTLTVGQLTDAIAKALEVVEDVEPVWEKGDRALIEVEVTGGGGNNVNVVIVGMTGNGRGLAVPSNILKEIAQ